MEFEANQEHLLIRRMIQINMAHRRLMERLISDTGVYRSQHHLLMYISCHEGLTQKEIAEGLEVSTATIAVSIKKLEKGGYLKKVVDHEDNRNNRIEITKRGKDVVTISNEIFQEIDSRMLQDFKPEEMKEFGCYLERIKKNLDAIEFDDIR